MPAVTVRDRISTAYQAWRADPPGHRAACVLVLVIGVAIRILHVNQPMRLDEARTFLEYALAPLGEALSNYRVPNNHIFHSLLVWLSVRVFGNAEWAVRLPALIAGVLAVPATYVAARVLVSRGAGLIAAALVAVLPSLILFSTNARGYSIVCLAFLLLIPLGDVLADDDSLGGWVAFALIVAVGEYTIPVMLYPAGIVSVWVLAERARRHGVESAKAFVPRLAGALAAAAVLAALAYAPVIVRYHGVAPLVSNNFVTPLMWTELLGTLPRLPDRLLRTLGLGIPDLVLAGLTLGAVLPLVLRRPARATLQVLAVATVVWCIVVLVATRRPPPGRVYLFLAPLCCLYAGIGLDAATNALAGVRRTTRQWPATVTALVLAAAIGGHTILRRDVFRSDETVTLVAAPDIARFLLTEVRDDDRVAYIRSTGPQVDYYLHTVAGRRIGDMQVASRTGRLLLILNERDEQTIQMMQTRRTDLKWSEFGPPTLLRQFPAASVYEARRR